MVRVIAVLGVVESAAHVIGEGDRAVGRDLREQDLSQVGHDVASELPPDEPFGAALGTFVWAFTAAALICSYQASLSP
jgi:hypothetical protein